MALRSFWRFIHPRVDVEVAVPIGCLVPLLGMLAVAIGLVRR
jgi:hypothetical protein